MPLFLEHGISETSHRKSRPPDDLIGFPLMGEGSLHSAETDRSTRVSPEPTNKQRRTERSGKPSVNGQRLGAIVVERQILVRS